MKEKAAGLVDAVRAQAPLVDAITNYVTINDCANILLAFGGSPAMCEAQDETYAFAQISGAVYINLGTLTKEQEAASVEAVLGAKKAGVPVVVDPAGVGAIPRKLSVLNHLLEVGRVDVVKGNGGEIKVLAGVDAKIKGVDSSDDEGIEEAAIALARKWGCVVAATGKVDVITDGKRLVKVENGVELMTKITGMGCMLGAICAATAAVSEDYLLSTMAAIAAMGIAGEMAWETAKFPGSFRVSFMDSIYQVDGKAILEKGRIVC